MNNQITVSYSYGVKCIVYMISNLINVKRTMFSLSPLMVFQWWNIDIKLNRASSCLFHIAYAEWSAKKCTAEVDPQVKMKQVHFSCLWTAFVAQRNTHLLKHREVFVTTTCPLCMFERNQNWGWAAFEELFFIMLIFTLFKELFWADTNPEEINPLC